MKKLAALGAAALLLVLAGCSSAPSHDEVRQEFLKDYGASMHLSKADAEEYFGEVADRAAKDALDGNCARPAYRSQLEDAAQLTAWDAICAKYFRDQLSQ